MELEEGLEFYRRCMENCKRVIEAFQADTTLSEERRNYLIDQMLDRMNEFQKRVDAIEELLR